MKSTHNFVIENKDDTKQNNNVEKDIIQKDNEKIQDDVIINSYEHQEEISYTSGNNIIETTKQQTEESIFLKVDWKIRFETALKQKFVCKMKNIELEEEIVELIKELRKSKKLESEQDIIMWVGKTNETTNFGELEKLLKDHDSQNVDWITRFEVVMKCIGSIEQENYMLEKVIEQLKKKVKEPKKKENKKEDESDTYNNIEEAKIQENDKLKKEIEKLNKNNDRLKDDNDELKQQIVDDKEELHKLTQEIEQLKIFNEKSDSFVGVFENRNGDLEKRCEELTDVNKKLEDVNKQLMEKNTESEEFVKIFSNENTLINEYCEMKKGDEKYKVDIVELIVKIKKLESEKCELKRECDSLKIENNELIRNKEDYVNDFTISSIQNSHLVEMNVNLESENKSLSDKISLLEGNMNNEEELKQQYDEKVLLFIDLQKKFKDLKNIKSELENNLEQTQNQLDKKNKELFTRTNEVEEIIKIEEYLKGIEKQFRNTLNNFEVQHNEYKDVLNTTINEKKKLMDGLEVIANYCKDQKQLITDQKRFLKTKDNEIVSLKQMNGYLLQQMNELVELAEEKLNSFNLYCKRGSEEEKVNVINNNVVVKQKQKIPISRIHWSSIPLKIHNGDNEIQIDNPRLGEKRSVNGETITFVQDEVDFIKLKETANTFDLLCVIDLTYCKGNTIDIHTPNGILLCQNTKGINGSVFKLEYDLGKNENTLYKNASLYVSFIQTYVENDNKFIFECGYTPPQCIDLTYNTYYCIIPVDYNKDVYYWNYQNREELFGYSDYYNFPVHFPIPVLKGEAYSIFYYINPDGINYQFIRLNVIAEKRFNAILE